MTRAVIPEKVGELRRSPPPTSYHLNRNERPTAMQVEYTTPVRRSLDREVTRWYRVYAGGPGFFILVRGGRLTLDPETSEKVRNVDTRV